MTNRPELAGDAVRLNMVFGDRSDGQGIFIEFGGSRGKPGCETILKDWECRALLLRALSMVIMDEGNRTAPASRILLARG